MAEIELTTHERIEAALEQIEDALNPPTSARASAHVSVIIRDLRSALFSAQACILADRDDINELEKLHEECRKSLRDVETIELSRRRQWTHNPQ